MGGGGGKEKQLSAGQGAVGTSRALDRNRLGAVKPPTQWLEETSSGRCTTKLSHLSCLLFKLFPKFCCTSECRLLPGSAPILDAKLPPGRPS